MSDATPATSALHHNRKTLLIVLLLFFGVMLTAL